MPLSWRGVSWSGGVEPSPTGGLPGSDLTEVSLADLRVLAQLLGGGRIDDGAGLQDVAAGGDLEGDVRVLLDEEDGGALGVDLFDDAEDALDEDGSQAHRGLVEEQELGAAHQGAPDGEHLLLAPAHRSGLLLDALLQAGKKLEDAGHIPAGGRPGRWGGGGPPPGF